MDMLSNESKIDIISEIIYDHLKGKHKDKLSQDLAKQIIEALDEEPPTWYNHG
jgi:aspartate/glutamate racemase